MGATLFVCELAGGWLGVLGDQLSSRAQAVAVVVAAVVVAVVIGAWALVVEPGRDRSAAGAVGPVSAPPVRVESSTSPAVVPVPVVSRGERVLFFGDSWTFGVGASSRDKRFAQVASDALGARPTIIGFGGVGYVNPGRDRKGTFEQRFKTVAAGIETPETVVVTGSVNDLAYSKDEIQAAEVSFIAAIKAAFPDADVLVVGPSPATLAMADKVSSADVALYKGAAQAKVAYVSSLDESWIGFGNLNDYMTETDPHPNDAGHRAFGAALAKALSGA